MAEEAQTIEKLTELIGNTPLVRLNSIPDKNGATVWGKCEHYNPGGSVKDRIALAMIERAEKEGRIRPGESTIIEPTSGNTGIGLALVCACKGYDLILTMPEAMSLERRALLQSYGAKLILTPEERVMEGAVSKATELCKNNSNYYMPDQFRNTANPQIHRETTAPELLAQMSGKTIDAFVAGIGTGGTITGVGEVLKKHNPECQVVGIEPQTSAVISGQPPGPHKIQGIGAGFVPEVLSLDHVDRVDTVGDKEAYDMKRRLAQEEGLLVGISAGANVLVATRMAAKMRPDQHVITILCDTGERYFSLDEYFES